MVRTKISFPVALFAHRGGACEALENTLPAFRRAAKLPAALLELDVQATKDGVPVVFHDASLGRLCGTAFKNVRICDLNYANLPPLLPFQPCQPHINIDIDKDLRNPILANYTNVSDKDMLKIPRLEELLREFPESPMQIDVKNSPDSCIRDVANLIRTFNRHRITVWGSFRSHQAKICRQTAPEIPQFFAIIRAFIALVFYQIGLLDYLTIHESALIIPKIWIFSSPGYISAIQARGVAVIFFGFGSGSLDDPAEWTKARELGANGICSNSPSILSEWLKNNPLRPVKN